MIIWCRPATASCSNLPTWYSPWKGSRCPLPHAWGSPLQICRWHSPGPWQLASAPCSHEVANTQGQQHCWREHRPKSDCPAKHNVPSIKKLETENLNHYCHRVETLRLCLTYRVLYWEWGAGADLDANPWASLQCQRDHSASLPTDEMWKVSYPLPTHIQH